MRNGGLLTLRNASSPYYVVAWIETGAAFVDLYSPIAKVIAATITA